MKRDGLKYFEETCVFLIHLQKRDYLFAHVFVVQTSQDWQVYITLKLCSTCGAQIDKTLDEGLEVRSPP